MQQPNFNHRVMPAGGELAEFNNLDFYSTVAGKIEDIRALTDIMRTQFEPGGDVVIGDEVNLNLLKQIDQHLCDLDSMAEWVVDNFEIVPDNGSNESAATSESDDLTE
ncbi:hypothetical protein [Methylomonas sp. DH-1]|uniref:hypothetical protein n=1 Tax=Methylomonas sp. (strain DH-1) TaxID=1727196 RepID=UPI0007C94B65|nr:hypothetical protein [Methylomonas sp. DH-1]ANE54425.1 hypothetical protein AYM39_03965 [Methylomonas sp. DH-1]ANE54462.1 hypothetical protein AYM39_04170 [Methylomonas sp. DH-1]